MNSEDTTLPLNEPIPDAPSTQPLLKEMMADIRDLKANSVTKAEFAQLVSVLERIEIRLDSIEARLDGIEREQRLTNIELGKMNAKHSRLDARVTMLEEDAEAVQKIAA